MTFVKTSFLLLVSGMLALALATSSSKVRLYSDVNYKGLLLEYYTISSCENLFPDVNDHPVSVQTEVCIMLYEHGKCTGRSIKITQDGITGGSNGKNLANLQFGAFHNVISSFKECTMWEGRSIVRVDLYKKRHFEDLLISFSQLGGCVNLKNGPTAVGSLNNHGNCVRAYFERDCKGMFAIFRAGQTEFSEDTEIFGTNTIGNAAGKVAWMSSLEPCFALTSSKGTYNTPAIFWLLSLIMCMHL